MAYFASCCCKIIAQVREQSVTITQFIKKQKCLASINACKLTERRVTESNIVGFRCDFNRGPLKTKEQQLFPFPSLSPSILTSKKKYHKTSNICITVHNPDGEHVTAIRFNCRNDVAYSSKIALENRQQQNNCTHAHSTTTKTTTTRHISNNNNKKRIVKKRMKQIDKKWRGKKPPWLGLASG